MFRTAHERPLMIARTELLEQLAKLRRCAKLGQRSHRPPVSHDDRTHGSGGERDERGVRWVRRVPDGQEETAPATNRGSVQDAAGGRKLEYVKKPRHL